jgi:fructuronate reductase
MKLNLQGISDRKQWEEKGYLLPRYDVREMIKNTKENPFWIHFGAGNLFRAFHANVVQNMLNQGDLDRGLVVAEGFDYEIVEKMYAPHDNLGIVATLKADGTIDKAVVASVAEALPLDSANEAAYGRLKEIFEKDSLQMATFTITEKGYSLVNGKGEILPDVESDFQAGPEKPASYMGKVSSLLYARYLAGKKPLAMVSTDNCSHNGDKLYGAISAFAKAWVKNGKAEQGFADYIDSREVSFTWSMIDKITPRPDASVEKILRQDGVEELDPVITSKNTYVAPFVNAEETEYLVIEDDFPNGRPDLTKGGLMFTDRVTVDKVEKMKVCTCLNPLHTCLAVFGCLLGYEKISDEMKDAELKKLVETVGYVEGLPVVVNPGILDPKEFIDTVLNVRVPNPFMPDTPQRIATDTSQKLAIRFGETIKAYGESDQLHVEDLKLIPLVLAGWMRYLMAIDDEGNAFALSPDPLLNEVCPYVEKIRLGDTEVEEAIRPIMENAKIFGINLYEAGLADKVCGYFKELISQKGAIRSTLKKYLGT